MSVNDAVAARGGATMPQADAGEAAAQRGFAAGRLDGGQVRSMFDRVAGIYDLMNSAMSAGLHHHWRSRAADLAGVGPGSRVLDVATGTGDMALELARRVQPGGHVLGSDFSEGMLARANAKAKAAGLLADMLRFEWGDAASLPYPADCFDAVTVAFGARNFEDFEQGLAEMVRVLRPGGRIVILEFTMPRRQPLASFYSVWFDRVVPLLGHLAGIASKARVRSRRRRRAGVSLAEAYAYLPSSVKRWPSPEGLSGKMADAGLTDIGWLLTAGGIVAIHFATVSS